MLVNHDINPSNCEQSDWRSMADFNDRHVYILLRTYIKDVRTLGTSHLRKKRVENTKWFGKEEKKI